VIHRTDVRPPSAERPGEIGGFDGAHTLIVSQTGFPAREAGANGRGAFAIATLILFVAAGVMARAGQVLEYAFPMAALITAVVLYRSHPAMYMTFVWWIWFLTPGIRRYFDYLGGWSQITPVSLTPYLVSGIALVSVFRHAPKLRRVSLVPFVLLLAAVGYGYLVGIMQWGFAASTYGALSLIVPIGFGLNCAMDRQRSPEYRKGVERAFLWGLLVVSVYGIIQYIAPTPWDAYWMSNAAMPSIGRPLPYQVRVFGTLNSPGPFAAVLAAGLLLVVAGRSRLRWPIAGVASVALLLTLVRGVWAAWLLGVAVYVTYLPWRTKWRVLAVLALLALTILLVISDQPFDAVRTRIVSFVDLASDRSFVQRTAILSRFSEVIAASPLGSGLGATGLPVMLHGSSLGIRVFDNGLLEILYSLGWAAGIVFLTGTAWLLVRALSPAEASDDRLAKAARGSAVCIAFTSLFGDAFSGVTGIILWTSLGLVVSATATARAEMSTPQLQV
jgi:hypothetical protein